MPSVSGIKAGNAYVVIGAIDDTGKMLAKIGRNLKKWGSSFSNLGLDLGFKAAMALTPAALGLNTFMKFDDLMKRTQSRTGATAAQIERLGTIARSAGQDIGMTATQLAEIFDELSQKNFNLGEMEKMARPIALLAKATGGGSEKDVRTAGKVMSEVLLAFGKDAGDAGKVADQLTLAANKSNFALDDLAEALTSVSATSASMGVSLEETIAIMSAMRNVGIQAESAGIGLRNIQLRAAQPKKIQEFNDVLASMGVTAVEFADKAGNMRKPVAILEDVMKAIKGLGTQTKADVLEELFGLRAINPALAAGNQIGSIKEMLDALNDPAIAGMAERVSQGMEAGIGGVWRRLINATQELAITFETVLEPALKMVGFSFQRGLKYLTEWIAHHPRLTTVIMASITGLFAFSAALIATGVAIEALGYAVSTHSLIFLAFDGARKVVTFGLKVLKNVFDAFTLAVRLAISGLKILSITIGLIGTVISVVSSLISGFFVAIQTIFLAIGYLGAGVSFVYIIIGLTTVISLGYMLFKMFDSGWQGAQRGANGFVAGLGRIKDFFGFFGTYMKNIFGDLWNTIVSAGLKAFATLAEGMQLAFQLAQAGQFATAWKVAIATVSTAFLNFWDEVSLKANEAFTDILNGFFQVFTEISNALSRAVAKMGFANPLAIPLQEANEGIGAGLNAMSRSITKRRQGEFDAKVEKVAAEQKRDLELKAIIAEAMGGMPDQQEGVADEIRELFKNYQGQSPEASEMDKMVKPLDGLEKGTIEAAKAAYEGSQDETGIHQLDALNGILNGIIALNRNLGVA